MFPIKDSLQNGALVRGVPTTSTASSNDSAPSTQQQDMLSRSPLFTQDASRTTPPHTPLVNALLAPQEYPVRPDRVSQRSGVPCFQLSGAHYDKLYSNKPYESEAESLKTIIETRFPGAHRVLDVGIGTGEHAKFLSKHFEVDGVDTEPELLVCARQKMQGKLYHDSMERFHTADKYDAIVCMFSVLGWARTVEAMRRTVQNFAAHLQPGGVAVIEPWVQPHEYDDGRLCMDTYESSDLTICRMSKAELDSEGLSVRDEHFLVLSKGSEVQHFRERFESGLFTRAQIERAMQDAGFVVEYEPQGLASGRGLYVGTLNGERGVQLPN